jgi:hypothetical protein
MNRNGLTCIAPALIVIKLTLTAMLEIALPS